MIQRVMAQKNFHRLLLLLLLFLGRVYPFFLSPRGNLRRVLISPAVSQDLPANLHSLMLREGVSDEAATLCVERAAQAMTARETVTTPFLSPADGIGIQKILEKVYGLTSKLDGGFGRAERKRLVLEGRDDESGDPEEFDTPPGLFTALFVAGDFLFCPCSPEQFEEGLLKMLDPEQRSLVGDVIVVGERGAQVVVAPEIVDILTDSVHHIANVDVICSQIDLSELCVRDPVRKDLQSVEGSLRIDAVGSAGMGMSRSKVAKLIKSGGGEILLNGKPATSASATIKAGDTVSIRNKGQVEIKSVATTAKGRYRISMTRFS